MSRTRKARRLAVGVGAAAALVVAMSAPAQAELPYEQDIQADVDGALAVPAVIGPDLEHVFPTGGGGVCAPEGGLGTLTGSVSEAHGGVHGVIDPVGYTAAAGDVVVTDDGAICGVLGLDIPDGEFVMVEGSDSGDFTLFDVTATLEITGTGAFEPHIPAGCTLSLDIGALTGTVSADGPPNVADASAEGVSIAEASADTCGESYSHLLNVGFDLPSSNASIALDLAVNWEADEPEPVDGAAVFQANCAVCHGAEGEGDAGPALQGIGEMHSLEEITATIRDGREPTMPAWEGELTPEEIDAVAGFVASLEGDHEHDHDEEHGDHDH